MKCPSCGIGFIPQKIKTRELQVGGDKDFSQGRMVVYGILLVVAVVTSFLSIWFGIAMAIIALLTGILIEVSRLSRK